MKNIPNFFIVGAAKSGTTSIAEYLSQHPDVFMASVKEPNYFALEGEPIPYAGPAPAPILFELLYSHSVTKREDYLRLFEDVQGKRAIGEASVRYLYYPIAPKRIHDFNKDARVVAILRDPVSRLYSHYSMMVQYQLEPLTLDEALEAEAARIRAKWGWDWHYVSLGRYGEQLKRYFEQFGRKQILVLFYDDFLRDPNAVFGDICRHIGVNDSFVPDMSKRGMVSYLPKNKGLDRWLHWPRSIRPGVGKYVPRKLPKSVIAKLEAWNNAPVPKLPNDKRKRLWSFFRDDVKALESLLGRKVPWHE